MYRKRVCRFERCSGSLEYLMSPQPVVAPDLDEAMLPDAGERRVEIRDDVLWTVGVDIGVKPPVQVPARLQGASDVVDRPDGVGEVLEHVHRGHDVEAVRGQGARLQIDEARSQASRLETPLTE